MPPSGADANIPLTPENNSTFTQALQQWLGRFFGWIYSPGITPTRMLTATSTSDIVANEPSSIQPQSAASSIHQNPPSDPKNTKSETREGQTNTVNMKLDIAIGINGPVLNQANVPLTNDYKKRYNQRYVEYQQKDGRWSSGTTAKSIPSKPSICGQCQRSERERQASLHRLRIGVETTGQEATNYAAVHGSSRLSCSGRGVGTYTKIRTVVLQRQNEPSGFLSTCFLRSNLS
ncbi:hypothetical protein M3Y94_00202400 [Aphelenchoides besseyi]|nr:hypothetical protein M3Y94_00202400 [Aphelenchoides besseyi]